MTKTSETTTKTRATRPRQPAPDHGRTLLDRLGLLTDAEIAELIGTGWRR